MSTLPHTLRTLVVGAQFFLGITIAFASPTTPISDFSNDLDGTVTHLTTNLMWMRCSMGQTWSGTTCTGNASTYDWDQATVLNNTITFAGYSDWRLPTITELQTIIEREAMAPAINTTIFPQTPASNFWSATSGSGSYRAYTVYFGDGYSTTSYIDSAYHVRLVRNVQLVPPVPPQANCSYTLSSVSSNVSPSGGTETLNVTASDTSCAWSATSDASWLHPSNTSGTGSSSWTFSVEANGDTAPRTGTLTIAGQLHTVIQTGASTSSIPVTGTVRLRPQVLMGGFDPILIDLVDESFKLFAIVRPGATTIQTVQTAGNNGGFAQAMTYAGTYANGDQLYEAVFTFRRGAFPEGSIIGDIFGTSGSQFHMSVIDTAQQTHSFPSVEFGNHVAMTGIATSPPTPVSATPGIRRYPPQVLAAGFDPQLIDLGDSQFDVVAIVRPGAVPIQSVALAQNQGGFLQSMTLVETLPNGDMKYRLTHIFSRGDFPEMRAGDLFGTQAGQFNIEVTDRGQQTHRFPNLRWGNYPAQ